MQKLELLLRFLSDVYVMHCFERLESYPLSLTKEYFSVGDVVVLECNGRL